VLGIASLGFLASALGVYFAPPFFGSGMFWLCVIASFALIFAVRATRNTPVLSFSVFLALAVVMGFEISPWIRALLGAGHSGAIFNAAVTTGVGMGALGIAAQFFRFNYRRVAGIAGGALLALVLVGLLSAFFHFIQPTVYSILTLGIFSVLVVVDFMRIRAGGDGQTPVELALSIYLDGLNIFLALTRIFSGGGRRD
jgi:modulator of FtsH protease